MIYSSINVKNPPELLKTLMDFSFSKNQRKNACFSVPSPKYHRDYNTLYFVFFKYKKYTIDILLYYNAEKKLSNKYIYPIALNLYYLIMSH